MQKNHKLMDKYDPKQFEQKLYKEWDEKGYFKPVENKNGKTGGTRTASAGGGRGADAAIARRSGLCLVPIFVTSKKGCGKMLQPFLRMYLHGCKRT